MRLINWNVQWGRNAVGDVGLARTLDEARRLGDFDVLCLQEVTRGFGTAQICRPHRARAHGARRRQFGNALATRLPVERVTRHALPWPADPAAPSMQRAALEAVLRAPGGPLRVIVTHLEFYSLPQRLAQVDALRALQQEAAGHAARPAKAENPDGPFAETARPVSAIICGDFNSAFRSDAYRRMLEPLAGSPAFIDAWTTLHPGATPPPTAGVYDAVQWSSGPLTCDFVFVTEDLRDRLRRCEIDGATNASDHQPILLELD
jgi:endonuclease/exonuclease/phosphatase family metal-dependent hydrolase